MQLAKRLDGIGEYYFSQKLREIDGLNKQGRDVINLGIGSPDRPPHADVIKPCRKKLQNRMCIRTNLTMGRRCFEKQLVNGIRDGITLG